MQAPAAETALAHEPPPFMDSSASRRTSHDSHTMVSNTPAEPVVSNEKVVENAQGEVIPEHELPKGLSFALIIVGLFMAVYIVALDSTIIAPAIPAISNDFNDLSSVTWYLSAYFATSTAFQPMFGPFYRINQKWTFLVCIFIFELGSLLCAVAPNANVFIGGRAVAGLGLAGGYVGVLTIISTITTLAERTQYVNGIGMIYAAGAVSGPLIGGAFTTRVTWRWCFYINLPIGGLTVATLILFFREPKAHSAEDKGWRGLWGVIKNLDWTSVVLLLGALITILLALQDGGVKYPWSSSRIYGLIIGFGLMVIVLIGLQIYLGDRAMMRPSILRKRTIWSASLTNFAIGGAYFSMITFLAYYFQIRGSSSLRSGVQLLPLIAGVCSALAIGGAVAPKVGYVPPFLYFGMTLFTISAGLLTLLNVNSSTSEWAGIQFSLGFASGVVWQMPFVASQTVLTPEESEVGIAMVVFTQTGGGAICFAINQAIYQNYFVRQVLAIPGLPNAELVAQAGVTAFRQLVPAEFIPQIEEIGVVAVRRTYYLGIVELGLALLFCVPWIEWISIKEQKPEVKTEEAQKVEA